MGLVHNAMLYNERSVYKESVQNSESWNPVLEVSVSEGELCNWTGHVQVGFYIYCLLLLFLMRKLPALPQEALWHLSVCSDVMFFLALEKYIITILKSIETKCVCVYFFPLLFLSYPVKALHIWWQNKVRLSLPLLCLVDFFVWCCMFWCWCGVQVHASL